MFRNARLNMRLRITFALEELLFDHPRLARPLFPKKRGTSFSALARYVGRRIEKDHRLAFKIRRRRLSAHLRSLYGTTEHVMSTASGTTTTTTKSV